MLLSAADSALAALADVAEGLPEDYPSLRLANWVQLIKPAAFDLYQDKVIDHAKVVVVSLLGGVTYWQYAVEQLAEWANAHPDRTLIIVPGDDTPDTELSEVSSVTLEQSHRVWRYLREGGVVNNRQLLLFLAAQYLHCEYAWQEPRPLPNCLIYLPGSFSLAANTGSGTAIQRFASYEDWQQYSPLTDANQPVCLLLFYRSHLQSANTAMLDGLIAQLQAQGLRPLPVAISSLKDAESLALVNELLQRSGAAAILNTTGFASNTVASPDLSAEPTGFESPFAVDVPVLQLILSSSTEDDWDSYSQGLRSRDIAMQVVLPEMDGRIATRAVSFKAEAWFSERCEIATVRYQLHTERAAFVAELVCRYCRLATKPNHQKRIALILANYPTKDGRIGNGVGLDTPASTLNILHAIQQAGYPVADIPDNGSALIAELLGAVTNNPETMHYLPCWQSLAVEEYRRYFAALPELAQQAVLSRWGGPEKDPKFRSGRLMLSGIRLGETFVGIQPARGFNMDLTANYHDPDLVPPHSYLAFYFWLRHCYQVDALIHVGKHGNLEWLPGKGVALSQQCWPDIALGPMPHFYPFIVNDPGEGAQAKRRAQAVIIDHLMPPITRAETYGELAELEALVDEYYQAMGMDSRREQWLREQILEQVRATHVLQELSVETQQAATTQQDNSDDELLAELDAYLCDIKEAQIRHGLHILGELPKADKLVDTLVALLRLPRGSAPYSQGILHNLASDLGLQNGDQEFDPLASSVVPWLGEKPPILQEVSTNAWRTEADTRERLELLAASLVQGYVVDEGALAKPLSALAHLPATCEQLVYVRTVLATALQQSVELEIQSLLRGLSGRFVEPGPSGAPTRGRLDTLPTGRNFFSVDNRSIPSPAAWAIGQRSAQALIERHLQEHGDYPRQVGLSVWGTATMRTGGDDIAQALALMGVKPIWAAGSQRVVDVELVPCMLLGRPRVDVTLRVSGFFRDAFPNVMKLYDRAVQALADYDEPGQQNTVQQHIRAREQQLIADGLAPEQAKRQASYRGVRFQARSLWRRVTRVD